MPRFSLRSKIRNPQANQDVIAIPEPVDDNQYLSASAQAAIADKASGAYDEYMFGGNELRQMPYETAVDTHLQLVSTRLKQRYGRALTTKRNQVVTRLNSVARINLRSGLVDRQLEAAELQIEAHRAVLNGEDEGRHGLRWVGHEPDFLGPLNARFRLLAHSLIFLVIGIVDIYVIWSSFRSMKIPGLEAAFLTAPAVAAQLAFPHLAGTRLAKIIRGSSKKLWIWLEVAVLLGIWGVFVYVMAVIRVRFIVDKIQTSSGVIDASYPSIFLLLNLVLLTALGGWLIFIAIRENPHEQSILANKLKLHVLANKKSRIERRKAKRESKLEISRNNLATLEEELDDSISASRQELSKAAKAVYRRALVNQLGSVDFTSAYLKNDGSLEAPNELGKSRFQASITRGGSSNEDE